MKVRLATASLSPVLGDKEANLDRMAGAIPDGADLVVFPEMFLTGYSLRDRTRTLAEPLDGPSVSRVVDMAGEHGCHILFGMPEAGDGVVYNTAVLVSPEGKVWPYRKIHLPTFGPFEERLHFTPGREPVVARTALGKIGLSICYDLFFPELSRLYALRGAWLVVNISASPNVTRRFFETLLPARAVENTVFMAYSNNVGVYRSMMFWGGGRVIGPRGDVLGESPRFEEDVLVVEADTSDLKTAREFRRSLGDADPRVLEIFSRAGERDPE
ncbi:MAG: carbon-nitrogen hydrolase family protein, partial [Thermoplasmata archaeon]|nr:carbon-nitrogen hydrolase family protein [Thermoplasmata archaeon]